MGGICPVWVSIMCFRSGRFDRRYGVIVALLINKYHPINYGRVVLVTDSLIICASLLVATASRR